MSKLTTAEALESAVEMLLGRTEKLPGHMSKYGFLHSSHAYRCLARPEPTANIGRSWDLSKYNIVRLCSRSAQTKSI
jgi:hypothetical protein